ncbi:hypothetical protein BJP32_16740, partial [Brevundimonas sp. ZS04]
SNMPLSGYGGNGNDTIRLITSLATSSSFVSGDDGDDLLDAAQARAVAMFGGRGNDVLIGSESIDELHGNEGDDQLGGNGGNDLLSGDAGSDKLACGQGDDAATLDLSDQLLEPDTAALGRTELRTDCETIGLPANGRQARINLTK